MFVQMNVHKRSRMGISEIANDIEDILEFSTAKPHD